MKIQISENKIIPDSLVVFNTPSNEIDIVMDLKNLTFKEGSIEEIYAVHILDRMFPDEMIQTISNWKKCLKTGGSLFIVVDDFEYISRAFVGGDISIDLVNDRYNHPTQFTQQSLAGYFYKAGFKEDSVNVWFKDVPKYKKKHYELVLEAKKND